MANYKRLMSTNQKSPIDINMIINTIKKVIDSVKSANQKNPEEATAPESVFDSIYRKVEDTMKQYNLNKTTAQTSDELGSDSGFLNDMGTETVHPKQAEMDKVKAEFKSQESVIKGEFQAKLDGLKKEFKVKHDDLKSDFQTKLDALK